MRTLLIVEDEKLIRQGIKVMVQRSGVPVERILECSNGEQALEVLKNEEVDVMFTDIRMPKMDGIALVKEAQLLPNVPLTVAVSGYDEFSYAVEMLRSGVREYLLKPVDRDKVKEILFKLNEELEAKLETAKQDRGTLCRQFKYVILNEKLTEEEKTQLQKQYEDFAFLKNYYMVCSNLCDEAVVHQDEKDYYYLSDVEGQELYLVQEGQLQELLEEELPEKYVGISGPHRGIHSLRQAYYEAFFARKEAFYLGKRAALFDKCVMRKEPSLHLEEASVSQMVQLLGTDKWGDALKQIARVFKNASLGGYSFAEIEAGMRVLLDDMFATYAGVLSVTKEQWKDAYGIYDYNNLEEYQAEIMGWLQEFCETLKSRYDDYRNKQKIHQAIAFIKENYNKDLNMAVVSNHISMNYSLFSYVFKQYTGTNFVNYLKEIRITEAKRLLEETDMKIIDISEQVGYDNEKHFMKIFKSACGVSPTEYRKNVQFRSKSEE
ncbi:MAG: response regulator [Lachnospiraceae bacterium]|nr:response regulator [Lachnospiraceae bacterium]